MSSEELKLKIAQLDELARAGRAILATIEAECKPEPERDICIRPEPKTGAEIWFFDDDTSTGLGVVGYNPVRDGAQWRHREAFLTHDEANAAYDLRNLRARAITARDAINGERGLPKVGQMHAEVDIYRPYLAEASVRVVQGYIVDNEWRFHTEDDARKWLAAIGGDEAFKNLMEVE